MGIKKTTRAKIVALVFLRALRSSVPLAYEAYHINVEPDDSFDLTLTVTVNVKGRKDSTMEEQG